MRIVGPLNPSYEDGPSYITIEHNNNNNGLHFQTSELYETPNNGNVYLKGRVINIDSSVQTGRLNFGTNSSYVFIGNSTSEVSLKGKDININASGKVDISTNGSLNLYGSSISLETKGNADNITLKPGGKIIIGDINSSTKILSIYGKDIPIYPTASTYEHKYYLQLDTDKNLDWGEYDKTTLGNRDASNVDYKIKSLRFTLQGGHEESNLLITSDSDADTSVAIKSICGKSLMGDANINCATINGSNIFDSTQNFVLLETSNSVWQTITNDDTARVI